MFCKKGVLRNFAKIHRKTCASLFFNKVAGLMPATLKTLAQVFCCEFCQISKNTILYRTPQVTVSVLSQESSIIYVSQGSNNVFELNTSFSWSSSWSIKWSKPIQSVFRIFCYIKVTWIFLMYEGLTYSATSQQTITCSKSTIETLEKGVENVQS